MEPGRRAAGDVGTGGGLQGLISYAGGKDLLKIIICIKRNPAMSRDAFHAYWKGPHAEVVREVAGPMGMRRNVHNRTFSTPLDERLRTGRGAEMEDYDGVAESWFDSLEALMAATATPEGRAAAQRLAEDEARFIDFSRSRIFFVEEDVVVDGD